MRGKWLHIIWLMLLVGILPVVADEQTEQEELCMDGTLLFREDFGGNEPNDPRVSDVPVQGMSYNLSPEDSFHGRGSVGYYFVTKTGYCNGDTSVNNVPQNRSSQWHIQDDHTYPNDYTRGYMMEIDGRGDNAVFYTTTIDGLCVGSKLTFSAYVANVLTWGQYVGRPGMYAYPRLKFVLSDPISNRELATYDTGDIPYDDSFTGDYTAWRHSSEWHLVGMNFTMPDGQNSIKLTISNNATGWIGNDFAIDDIEIRLCAPPVTIEGEAEVCANVTATLTANFTNDGTFAEPVEYKWFFSADSVSWETVNETSNVLNLSNVHKADSGWYRVAVAGADNIESLNCRAMSAPFLLKVNECVEDLCIDGTLLYREDFGGNDPNDPDISMASVPGMSSQYHNAGPSGPSSGRYTVRKEGWANGIQWHRQDDHTYPNDKTRGYLLEVDGIGGAEPFYSTTIDGLCAGSKLTFSAYVVNVHYAGQINWLINNRGYVYPRMKFVLKDPTTGSVLAEKTTGDILPDSRYTTEEEWRYARENSLSAEWQLIGMNFVVPDGIESIQMYIYNDVAHNGTGNDFALDDIEIHLCAPPVTIEGDEEVCVNETATLTANFTNAGTFAEPLEYKWWFSSDSVTWSEMSGFNGEILTIDAVQKADSGWYQVAVAGAGNIESVNCRAMNAPFLLSVKDCEPPEQELCMDGTLLFREDFGGNDPNDPESSSVRPPGMDNRYWLGSNCYLTKKGKRNSSSPNYSLWHIQDDHTYPNDYSRGYFLEIDGVGNNIPFYSTMIDGLCEGSEMTFTAYVVNVTTANQIVGYWQRNVPYAYPHIRMVLTNPEDNSILAVQEMDTIGYDWSLYKVSDAWRFSAQWQLVGMNFTVPEGVDAIRLTIDNFVTDYSGNDFAIDDIEIRICLPPVKIVSQGEVCIGEAYDFEIEFENDGSMPEPLEYQWYFSNDSDTWVPIENGDIRDLSIPQISENHIGWYKLAVAGADNINRPNCRAMSAPKRLVVNNCTIDPKRDTIIYTVCDSIVYNGVSYYSSFTVSDTMTLSLWQDSIHTDSIIILHSTWGEAYLDYHDDSIVYKGIYYYETTHFVDTLKGVNGVGCDSLIDVMLYIKHLPKRDTTVYADCDSVEVRGKWYMRSCYVSDTTAISMMQDSIHTDCIIVWQKSPGSTWRRGLDSIAYKDIWYFRDTTFVEVLEGASEHGCDSILTVILSIEFSPEEPPIEPPTEDTIPDPPEILPPVIYDTVPLIINKYNWVIIRNNTLLYDLYPNAQVQSFCWYRNDTCMSAEFEDFYTEDRLLEGDFRLVLYIAGKPVYSNLIEIHYSGTPAPPRLERRQVVYEGEMEYEVFTASGRLVAQGKGTGAIDLPEVRAGVYIVQVRYEFGRTSLKWIVQ